MVAIEKLGRFVTNCADGDYGWCGLILLSIGFIGFILTSGVALVFFIATTFHFLGWWVLLLVFVVFVLCLACSINKAMKQ